MMGQLKKPSVATPIKAGPAYLLGVHVYCHFVISVLIWQFMDCGSLGAEQK